MSAHCEFLHEYPSKHNNSILQLFLAIGNQLKNILHYNFFVFAVSNVKHSVIVYCVFVCSDCQMNGVEIFLILQKESVL